MNLLIGLPRIVWSATNNSTSSSVILGNCEISMARSLASWFESFISLLLHCSSLLKWATTLDKWSSYKGVSWCIFTAARRSESLLEKMYPNWCKIALMSRSSYPAFSLSSSSETALSSVFSPISMVFFGFFFAVKPYFAFEPLIKNQNVILIFKLGGGL